MIFLIVDQLINVQQNRDILNLCNRANLKYKHVKIIGDNLGNVEFLIDGEPLINILDKDEYYFSVGSYNLAIYLKEKRFKHGHNLDNLSQDIQMINWGSNLFLNSSSMILLDHNDLKFFKGKRFFRTVKDTKNFSAGCFEYDEIKYQDLVFPLMMASVRKIEAEYRFIIINNEIVDNSSYLINNKPNIIEKASISFSYFVESLLEKWVPTDNFIIDIASVNGEPKVIEVNNIHCSRFYGCSINKVINKALFLSNK